MSRARLRAAHQAPPTPPDLLLRSFEPPDVAIHGTGLAVLLAPAYQLLAGQEAPEGMDARPASLDKQTGAGAQVRGDDPLGADGPSGQD